MTNEPVTGVRFSEPTQDHLDWCERVGVEPPFSLLMLDVTLRCMADGTERTFVDETGFRVEHEGEEDEALQAADYMWRWGNYGCDCNRALMFARAGGDDEYDDECGHRRFRIVAPEWLAEV